MNNFFSEVSKVMPEVSKVFNNVKGAIQTNVTQIVNNLSGGKPTLGGRVKVGNRELEEVRLISQGGYAYVFEVKDVETGEIFALKKMFCQSTERLRTAKNEIKILQSLPDHPNLLKLYDSELVKVSDGHHAYILMEYCDGGSVYDLMVKYESTKLSERQIIFVMREACEGVRALHSCDPPIVHRDLKIENVLVHNKKFKLCDFGSCSSRFVDFSKIPQKEYAFYEEEYDKNTTLMYRPPEMCDPYMKYVVNEKVDVWMLGCILYTMCFYKSPFQEASKLAIVNGGYTFPKDHQYPEKLIDIIRIMLTPNPQNRPSIFELSDIFSDYFSIESIQLNEEAQRIKEESAKKEHQYKQEKKPKTHDDIPIEELMKIQKKVQNKIKKTQKNEPQFVEWGQAKYPGQKSSNEEPEVDEWGAFHSSNTQVSGAMFETFGQFNENNQQKNENGGTWDAFDFGAGTKAAESQSANNNDWNPNLWETPQFTAEKEQKVDANNFDFFGDFSTTTSEKKDQAKPEIQEDLI